MSNLIDMILKEADEKCDLILKSSNDSINLLVKNTREKTEKIKLNLDNDKNQTFESIDREYESFKRSLQAKYSNLQKEKIEKKLFTTFEKEINNLCQSDKFKDVLVLWAIEAVTSLQKDDVILITNPKLDKKDIEKIRTESSKILNCDLKLKVEESNLSDYGCITNSSDGYVSYSNLVKDRKRRFRKEISRIVDLAIVKRKENG